MAATGLLALLDDITTLLDDVAVYSKVAVKKSAGVLGDDLALNAEQVSGVDARRELPVVWAVARVWACAFLGKLKSPTRISCGKQTRSLSKSSAPLGGTKR